MRKAGCILLTCLLVVSTVLLFGCSKKQDESWKTNEKFDLSLPVLNSDGWYLVFEDDFEGTSLSRLVIGVLKWWRFRIQML